MFASLSWVKFLNIIHHSADNWRQILFPNFEYQGEGKSNTAKWPLEMNLWILGQIWRTVQVKLEQLWGRKCVDMFSVFGCILLHLRSLNETRWPYYCQIWYCITIFMTAHISVSFLKVYQCVTANLFAHLYFFFLSYLLSDGCEFKTFNIFFYHAILISLFSSLYLN